jgi:hypothetical protein
MHAQQRPGVFAKWIQMPVLVQMLRRRSLWRLVNWDTPLSGIIVSWNDCSRRVVS